VTDILKVLNYAALGAIIGAVAVPAIIFCAIRLNYKNIGTYYAQFPKDAPFYRVFAFAGAATFAIIVGSQPVLDELGANEIYLRGALIPVLVIGVGIPMWRALRRLRDGRS
jgi:hypothetical protein